jgi:hypothetical protein
MMKSTPPRAARATATEILELFELHSLEWWAENAPAVHEAAQMFRLALDRLAAAPPHSAPIDTAA